MDPEIDLPKQLNFNWKKIVLLTIPITLLAGLFIAKIGNRKERAEGEYVTATQSFVKWDQILDQREEAFANLQKVIKKHPELHAHYDPLIGQNFLASYAPNEAKPYVERTLKRTKQPYYSDFARTSLAISENRHEEALNEAYTLKEKMLSDHVFWENNKDNSALFAFNLLRIATLNQHLGNQDGEREAWREIKKYGGWEKGSKEDERIGQEGFKQLLSHFTVQETSLLDYIKSREERL